MYATKITKISKNIINIIIKYIYNNKFLYNCNFLEKHIDKLEWDQISLNQHIPFNFLNKYQDKIHWNKLTYRPDIPIKFIENNILLSENLDGNLPFDFICNNINKLKKLTLCLQKLPNDFILKNINY